MSLDNEREKLVYMAKLAEQAERYDDMVNHMEKVAKLNVELSLQERQLLSSAYKNVIGARRGASRIFSINECMEESEGNENNVKIIKVYHQEVQEELTKLCNDVLALIDDHLIPYASSVESKIFYYKMKGDYYRYVAEYKTGQERKEVAELSREAYRVASDIASDNLPYAHALRLGVALNLSVFYYEIEESPEKAWEFARQTIENAFLDLDSLSEESYRESTLIMQLLRENMTFWKLDSPDEEEDVEERDAPAESEGR